MQCIVLAGGLGTRLQSVIGEFPKCMAPVDGRPFLHYLIAYLQEQGCKRLVLSLGFKHEVVLNWLGEKKLDMELSYVVEERPLGTGGGILLAMDRVTEDDVLVLNGDTMFKVELRELISFHKSKGAATTIALKEMHRFDRYGAVVTTAEGSIDSFEEKQFRETGLINGGVYVLNKQCFLAKGLTGKFSFEKDYLEAYVNEQKFYGKEFDDYFIDIGIP